MAVANRKRTRMHSNLGASVDLESELIRLTDKWYRYVNLDHHKDRDCHWYITKTYSYGDPAKYTVSHHGYRSERFESKEFDNEEDAMLFLIKHLSEIFKERIEESKQLIEENEMIAPEDRWHSLELLKKELAILEEE